MPNVLDELAQRLAGMLTELLADGPEPEQEPRMVDDSVVMGQSYGETVDGHFISGAWRSVGNNPDRPHP